MVKSINYLAIDEKKLKETPQTLEKGKPESMRLGQSIMLEERGPSSLLKISIFMGFVALAAFIGWAHLTVIEEVAVASGEVIPSGTVQSIQHIDGGRISSIAIEEGSLVKKDQVLLTLDPTDIKDQIKQFTTQLVIWKLKAARLYALSHNSEFAPKKINPRFAALVEEQKDLLEIQRLDHKSQQHVLETQIKLRQTDWELLKDQIKTLENQLAPLIEQMEIRKGLLKNNTVSRFDFLESQRQFLKERGQLDDLVSRQKTTEQAIVEARGRWQELNSRFRRETLDELASSNTEAVKIEEEISRLMQAQDRLIIKSPVAGIVQGLDVNSIGTVIRPGSPILSVVPVDQDLIVEARIRPEDIGFIQVGQNATVKFTTFNYSRYGYVTGELSQISATTFEDEKGENFYKGKISLTKTYVGERPEENQILPGMTATADIHSGEKTLMDYLLKPIHTTLTQSFRER
jgi:membrane fusion protein, adhesin transport system